MKRTRETITSRKPTKMINRELIFTQTYYDGPTHTFYCDPDSNEITLIVNEVDPCRLEKGTQTDEVIIMRPQPTSSKEESSIRLYVKNIVFARKSEHILPAQMNEVIFTELHNEYVEFVQSNLNQPILNDVHFSRQFRELIGKMDGNVTNLTRVAVEDQTGRKLRRIMVDLRNVNWSFLL